MDLEFVNITVGPNDGIPSGFLDRTIITFQKAIKGSFYKQGMPGRIFLRFGLSSLFGPIWIC